MSSSKPRRATCQRRRHRAGEDGLAYARFIPREELSGFAAGSPARCGGRRRPRAPSAAPPPSADAAPTAGRAARGAPGRLPGRLPRRPGRARQLQAELRAADDRADRRARCRASTPSSTRCEREHGRSASRASATAAGAPGRAQRAGDAARAGRRRWRSEAVERRAAAAPRHITVQRAPRRPCRWSRKAPPRRWPHAARGCMADASDRARRLPRRVRHRRRSTPASTHAGRRRAGCARPATAAGRRTTSPTPLPGRAPTSASRRAVTPQRADA